jgi:transcriptional regulator with XRE-family HTH domain
VIALRDHRWVDDARIGRSLWVLRRRRGLRQSDVAAIAGVSQSSISKAERGHSATLSVAALRRVFAAVDAGFEGTVIWRGGGLERLLDERHAAILGVGAQLLETRDWEVVIEATYAVYGERGSVDILAAHARSRTILVVEVKTELVSIEQLGRKVDEKVRLARQRLCRDRFGWMPTFAGRLLVLPDLDSRRRAVHRHAAVLDIAFPARGSTVRAWLRKPASDLSGILFVADMSPGTVSARRRGAERVRRRTGRAAEHESAARLPRSVVSPTASGRLQRGGE